jgi:type 1 fimbria pilin
MNNRLSLFTAAVLLTGASSAFAASSTDLTVTGTITPAACTPSLANGGIADHGKISVQDLNPDKPTYLPEITMPMTVSCDAATLFAITPIDNRAGTGTSGSYFGLGLINTNEKLGNFRVIPRNVMADATNAQAILSTDGGKTWLKEGSTAFWGVNNIWSVGALGADIAPIAVKDLSIDLYVRTGIAATNSLTLTDEVKLDGSATLQIKYL